MGFAHNSVPYLEALLDPTAHRDRVRDVAAAIERFGFWEDHVEWRISTVTTLRIDPEVTDGRRWYRVRVVCDGEMTCRTPTIERAVEFMTVYERLTADLFWTFGWPSWARAERPEPLSAVGNSGHVDGATPTFERLQRSHSPPVGERQL